MATVAVNYRMNKKLRDDFSVFCKKLGISMSTAMTLFAAQAVKEQRIPFEITAEPDLFWNEENQRALAEAAADFRGDRKHFAKFNPEENL
ncbi:MAG: type II toxin-antitoxin system RelB/DinJ family antitoxin [Synergistaceae bacterium]|nr:type II toxin-antitoxin system RelB/DinJ family antitoxin [Synergistaceae bacterium]